MSHKHRHKARIIPADEHKLKSIWKPPSTHSQQPEQSKKLRIFNQNNHLAKGKIIIDHETFVEYDYTQGHHTKLHKKNINDKPVDKFTLPNYPTLKYITSDIPSDPQNLSDNDFIIVKDIDEILLWNNNELQLHST